MIFVKKQLKRKCLLHEEERFSTSGYGRSFECPGGLTVLTVPIVYQDHVIGYVEGGYVYITPKKNDLSNKSNTETGYLENEQNLYLAPISSVENSRKMLNRIAAMIRHFCEIQQHQKELEEQEKS